MKIIVSIILTFLSFLLYGQSNFEKKILYYELGKTQLTKKNQLELNSYFKEIDSLKIQNVHISGYADSIGSNQINLQFSKFRALNIVHYFIRNGIPDSLINVSFFGESKSPFPPSSNIPNERNRCVVIQIIGNKKSTSKTSNFAILSDTTIKLSADSLKFENDTTLQFPNGTIIEVDAGTFYPIKIKDVQFQVTEIFTLCDMIKNNRVTHLNRNTLNFSKS